LDAGTYGGPLPTGVSPGGAPLYSAGGFVWQNESGYGGDCQSMQGDSSAATLYALDNLYTHESCGNNLGMVRTDGARFSVSSIDVAAQELTRMTPVSTVVASGTTFLPFVLTELDILDELDAANISIYTPESDALLAQLNKTNDQLRTDYQAWLNTSGIATQDRFYVVGYRNGVEVVRQVYGDTGGQSSITLNGFSDIDEIVFGYQEEAYLWDQYSADIGGLTVLRAGQTWCGYNCEQIDIFGFDYALAGGSKPGTGVSAVPLPAGVWMMVVALGLLGWKGRQKV